MAKDDGRVCCILGVCCRRGSKAQREALADALTDAQVCDTLDARAVATWLLQQFDLAPAGSLDAFKVAIAQSVQKGRARRT